MIRRGRPRKYPKNAKSIRFPVSPAELAKVRREARILRLSVPDLVRQLVLRPTIGTFGG